MNHEKPIIKKKEWIGRIPADWDFVKIKEQFVERNTKVDDISFPPLSVSMGGVVDQMENVSKSDNSENRKLVKKNDFVINSRSDRKGSSGISPRDGSVSLINIVLKPKNINPKYSEYLFKSYYFKEEFFRNGKGIHFDLWSTRYELMKQIIIPYPKIEEQNEIVEYLDNKTHQIEKLTKKIEQKIELLKEQRTSLINEVVTKGLNPDVEMKDSGIEWVGKIPTDWEVLKLKRVGEIYGGLTGKSGDDFGQEDSPLNKPYIPYTNIFRNTYISREHFDLVSIEPEETQNNVKRLDLFFLMSSENYDDLGKTSILVDDVGELYLNSFCKGFRINNSKTNPLFLNYQLNGDVFKKLISINGFGFTRINLRQDKLLSISILLPPLIEQEQIILYLDKKTKVIDETISKEVRRIELLKEYKQSLISEVVTGKKRVV